MPTPMTCDISNHNNNGIILLVFCHLLRQVWYFVFYMDFHFYMVYRDPRRSWWLRLQWGSHFWHGDITKLISDWTRVSCRHYLQEATSNFQCVTNFFQSILNSSPLLSFNNSYSTTNMMLLLGLPYFCLMAFWHFLYENPYINN